LQTFRKSSLSEIEIPELTKSQDFPISSTAIAASRIGYVAACILRKPIGNSRTKSGLADEFKNFSIYSGLPVGGARSRSPGPARVEKSFRYRGFSCPLPGAE
jgi:hypothetical protein